MLTALLLIPFAQQEPLLERRWEFPLLDRSVIETRWLDPQAGTILRRASDRQGRSVDLDALRRAEHAERSRRNGKLAPELLEELALLHADSPVEVVFWLQCSDAPDWRSLIEQARASGSDVEAARREARDLAADYFAARTAEFGQFCREQDWTVTQTLGAWPVVYVVLPAGEVPGAAQHPLVDEAYFCFQETFTEQEHAQRTMRTPLVWASGLTAAGSPVKTMVNDPDHVTKNNPYLPPVVWIYGSGGVGSHASACAGNIAMDDGSMRGAAYGLPQIYSADGTGDSGAPSSWNAAISNGIDFGNCSWWNGSKGQIVYLDRFFDYTIRNFGVMMFKSTGNQGNTSEPYTTTPGNGYNSTNSGSYNDGNDFSWGNDAMASYSSYWDPAEGHEKPELASPGDDVDTTGTSTYYTSFGGTSSASPLTCGVATLLASREPALRGRPEAVKAILMASAWHNVEGDDVLSEYDGVGGVHALAADRVARDGHYHTASLTAADFANPANAYEVTFLAAKGNEVRLCGLWFSTANSAYSTDVLNMDLDLVVLDPTGNVVASSANAANSFEILKFTPTKTGAHTARLVAQRFDGVSEPFALAWSSRYDTAEAIIEVSGTPQVGGAINLDFDARYRPDSWFQAHVSGASLPNITVLGDGYVLPMKSDSTYAISGGLPGMSGTLNSSGQAGTVLNIPANAALANRTFYLGMYTKSSAGDPTIRTISQVVPVTVLP
jgi:hypothetical protein